MNRFTRRQAPDPALLNFTRWLENAEAGEKYCYFVGSYLEGPVAREAYNAYEDGEVILYQKRTNGIYSYLAEKRKNQWEL